MLALAITCGVPAMGANTYVMGGLSTAIDGSTYGWDGSFETNFRAALQNSALFGAGGTFATSVSTVNITSTASLTGINGLVVPWWANASASVTQVNQVVAFFNAGGDLLLAEDDSSHAPVGIALGVPVAGGSSSPWTAAGALASGPFGPVTTVNSYFNISFFNAATITSLGGTVGARDGSNNVTAAYWPKHTFCPTCGALVMEGDVDVWATGATFTPLNANGDFTLNMVAYMIQNTGGFTGSAAPSATPLPSSILMALLGLSCLGIYFAYRSRRVTS
jgi:hypothetical protein